MKVDSIVPRALVSARPRPSRPAAPPAARPEAGDRVTLSADAMRLRAEETARLVRLRADIESGRYRVDLDRVADAMLKEVLP